MKINYWVFSMLGVCVLGWFLFIYKGPEPSAYFEVTFDDAESREECIQKMIVDVNRRLGLRLSYRDVKIEEIEDGGGYIRGFVGEMGGGAEGNSRGFPFWCNKHGLFSKSWQGWYAYWDWSAYEDWRNVD